MITKLFAVCRTLTLISGICLVSAAQARDCGGLNQRSLVRCESIDGDTHVSVTDRDEEVIVNLIKNGAVISKEEGLGIATLKMKAESGESPVILIQNAGNTFIVLRTATDRMGLIWVFMIHNEKLNLLSHTSSAGVSEFVITTHIESEVEIKNNRIKVRDRFFEADYEIKESNLTQIKFQSR